VGALGDRRKGFDTLFATWELLCRRADWDAQLVVIGHGAELPAWRDRIRSSGMSDRIQFLGFRRDVPDLLRAADVLIAPTRYEAYGLGVHEAVCCGLPALVSAEAGVAEQYPNSLRDWLIPDANDQTDLATRLLRWRANPGGAWEAFAGFASALRRRTWDHMSEDFLAAINA
jgi:glycosyltransferase involved in cell wall biosynthesis